MAGLAGLDKVIQELAYLSCAFSIERWMGNKMVVLVR